MEVESHNECCQQKKKIQFEVTCGVWWLKVVNVSFFLFVSIFYLTVKYNRCITKYITRALFSSLNLSMSGINSAASSQTHLEQII